MQEAGADLGALELGCKASCQAQAVLAESLSCG